jgi:hypothetical protein
MRKITKLFKNVNKNSFSHTEHNTKYIKAPYTNKGVYQKWDLPNEMLRLPTKVHWGKQ